MRSITKNISGLDIKRSIVFGIESMKMRRMVLSPALFIHLNQYTIE